MARSPPTPSSTPWLPTAARPSSPSPTDPNAYRFDIRLQGEGETVFIDYGVDW